MVTQNQKSATLLQQYNGYMDPLAQYEKYQNYYFKLVASCYIVVAMET